MKLLDSLESVPEEAGLAKIHIGSVEEGIKMDDRTWQVPHPYHQPGAYIGPERYGDHIFLPLVVGAEYYPLKEGEQFLFMIPSASSSIDYNYPDSLFFGGTDERPFLVQVSFQFMDIFFDKGEAEFYEALKPLTMFALEDHYGRRAERQGDIFYFSLGASLEEITFERSFINDLKKIIGKASVDFMPCKYNADELNRVFDTRHIIQGPFRENDDKRDSSRRRTMPWFGLGQGTLTAPDHSPRTFDSLHALAQTKGLVGPQNTID